MIWLLSLLVRAIYFVLPAAAIIFIYLTKNKQHRNTAIGTIFSGILLAVAILYAYAIAIGAKPSTMQIVLAFYFGASMMLLLRLFDNALKWSISRALLKPKSKRTRWKLATAILLRVVILSTIALPWVMSGVMVYRPRIIPDQTPASVLKLNYDSPTFQARDGFKIAGWYIESEIPSDISVLLCHGLGANKAGMWMLMNELHYQNINILTIDFRAHGDSTGQLSTFGAKESLDVEAAIDWLTENHPEQSKKIVSIGASLGGAASIRAAADDPRIDAVAVMGTFDSLPALEHDISSQHMVPPISWLTDWLGLPMASLHTGENLTRLKPAEDIARIWPRPVLIMHGGNDEIIPYQRGQRLFDAASLPRYQLFTNDTHNSIMDNPEVIRRIIQFIFEARPVPVI